MKRIFCLLAIIACYSFSSTATASNKTVNRYSGGFTGAPSDSHTVDSIKSMRNGSWVRLSGKIRDRLDYDRYLFGDNTGTIRAEIYKKTWRGETISPDDQVEIYGMVSHSPLGAYIQVKEIRKVS